MLRSISHASFGKSVICHTIQIGDFTCLIHHFIHLVTYGFQCIHEPTCLNHTCHHQIRTFLVVQDILQIDSSRHFLWSNYLLYLMNYTVDSEYIAVLAVDGAVPIDIDTIWIRHVVHRQLVVVQIGNSKLLSRLSGEAVGFIVAVFISAIDNTVIYNHFAD